MKNSSKSFHHLISLLFGLVASVGTMCLWVLLFFDSTISVLTSILLLLPAVIGLITSFVRPPLIIISFVISFPFSLYLFFKGNMFKLFMTNGMTKAKYRGLFRMRIQAILTTFVVNVKRMIKLTEKMQPASLGRLDCIFRYCPFLKQLN